MEKKNAIKEVEFTVEDMTPSMWKEAWEILLNDVVVRIQESTGKVSIASDCDGFVEHFFSVTKGDWEVD